MADNTKPRMRLKQTLVMWRGYWCVVYLWHVWDSRGYRGVSHDAPTAYRLFLGDAHGFPQAVPIQVRRAERYDRSIRLEVIHDGA